jgi:hypothetical protein
MIDKAELKSQIAKVRDIRANLETTKAVIDDIERNMHTEHAEAYDALEFQENGLRSAEELLRRMTLAYWKETGEKKPAPGVGIRMVNTLEYDELEALNWAVEAGAANCLTLQKAKFKKVAEGLRLDFVTIREEPQATISKEL